MLFDWQKYVRKYSVEIPPVPSGEEGNDAELTIGISEGVNGFNNTEIISLTDGNAKKIAVEVSGTEVAVDAYGWTSPAGSKGTPIATRDLGSLDDGDAGLTVIGSPIDFGTYYNFSGSSQGLNAGVDLGNSATEDVFAVFRCSDRLAGPQVIWQDGANTNGVGIGIDASGNLGLFGRSGGTLTSITIPPSSYSDDVWYEIWAIRSEVVLIDFLSGSVVARATGTCTSGDGSGDEGVANAIQGNVVNGTSSRLWFYGDIDTIEIYTSGDLVPPADATGSIFIPASNFSAENSTKIFIYVDPGHIDNDNVTVIGTPPSPYWDSADLVYWSLLSYYETIQPFNISSVVEQYKKLAIPLSSTRERAQQLRLRPSRKAERAVQLLIDVSTLYEKTIKLPIVGFIGREAFKRLRISGALQQLEQYRNFTIQDFDRVYLEAFQRFSIYAGLAKTVHNAGVHLFIAGSPVPFISGSGGDQEGVYFKVFEFVTPVTDLIRSLPDPDKSVPSAQIAWTSEVITDTGTEIVFDRTIELIFDAITYSRITDQSSRHTAETATLRLVSPTAALGYLDGNLGASPITASWPSGTMAGTILQDIFPDSINYDLQINDFSVGQLDIDGLYPNEIIPLVFLRTIIHTADDGTLIIRNEPETEGTLTPTHDLTPQAFEISAIESDDQGQYRPNFIRVSNYQEASAADSLRAPEIVVDPDDPRKAAVYAYPVPFRQVWLRSSHLPHSGYILTVNGTAETIEAGDGDGEELQFVKGVANTAYPITGGLISVDFGSNTDLGTVIPSEDGTLTAAISSRSLSTVKYMIKRYKFEIADYDEHNLQIWFVDKEDL